MKKIVLLNAPPSSGKDFGADFIVNNFKGAKKDKFARVLKERTHALYGFPSRGHDYYEAVKNKPNKDFYDLTPRQAYINVSELYFKPVHGNSIFGNILADELDRYAWEIVVISDSGFVEEAQVLINKYGKENVILIQIERDGCDFNNDSRNYIDLGSDICTTLVSNDGTDSYTDILKSIVNSIIDYES